MSSPLSLTWFLRGSTCNAGQGWVGLDLLWLSKTQMWGGRSPLACIRGSQHIWFDDTSKELAGMMMFYHNWYSCTWPGTGDIEVDTPPQAIHARSLAVRNVIVQVLIWGFRCYASIWHTWKQSASNIVQKDQLWNNLFNVVYSHAHLSDLLLW